jgi:hypothetical protein
MFVTSHAQSRIHSRLGYEGHAGHLHDDADGLLDQLEAMPGELGTVAYYWQLGQTRQSLDGSNGNLLVVIAVDGSVDTVYLRRSTQDMSPSFFGADKVVRL